MRYLREHTLEHYTALEIRIARGDFHQTIENYGNFALLYLRAALVNDRVHGDNYADIFLSDATDSYFAGENQCVILACGDVLGTLELGELYLTAKPIYYGGDEAMVALSNDPRMNMSLFDYVTDQIREHTRLDRYHKPDTDGPLEEFAYHIEPTMLADHRNEYDARKIILLAWIDAEIRDREIDPAAVTEMLTVYDAELAKARAA